jgi:hypothetical protein
MAESISIRLHFNYTDVKGWIEKIMMEECGVEISNTAPPELIEALMESTACMRIIPDEFRVL